MPSATQRSRISAEDMIRWYGSRENAIDQATKEQAMNLEDAERHTTYAWLMADLITELNQIPQEV